MLKINPKGWNQLLSTKPEDEEDGFILDDDEYGFIWLSDEEFQEQQREEDEYIQELLSGARNAIDGKNTENEKK